MVLEEGLEPSWGLPHTDLSRARIPIPPLERGADGGSRTLMGVTPPDP